VTPNNALNSNETVVLITNNVDSAVVFKDLKVQTLNNTTQIPESNEKTTNNSGRLSPYAYLLIPLIAAFAATIVYVKKKRQMIDKKQSNKVLTAILEFM